MDYRVDYIWMLRDKVLNAEQERINGAKTLSVSEARKKLKERFKAVSNLDACAINGCNAEKNE